MLIETAKLNGLDPEAYLRAVICRIADQPHRGAAALEHRLGIASPRRCLISAQVKSKIRSRNKTVTIARTKELLIQNPKLPLKDLQAQLAAEGFTPSASTISTVRTDFPH